ncbi:hypothetical protein BC940DRAFT_135459 [Gongronella butleri]|nr:hypothetical protein BC940DRAFT_135459 [Gongronella butleri]
MSSVLTPNFVHCAFLDQVVSVRPGLMRNVLYPSGKACYVVKGAVSLDSTDSNEAESATPVVDTHEQLLQQQAVANQVKHMVEQVQALHFKRAVVPGSEGIFGSVSVDDIVQALKEQGVELEKATVNLDSKIKQLGKHNVEITLADQSTVSLTVNVDAE